MCLNSKTIIKIVEKVLKKKKKLLNFWKAYCDEKPTYQFPKKAILNQISS